MIIIMSAYAINKNQNENVKYVCVGDIFLPISDLVTLVVDVRLSCLTD